MSIVTRALAGLGVLSLAAGAACSASNGATDPGPDAPGNADTEAGSGGAACTSCASDGDCGSGVCVPLLQWQYVLRDALPHWQRVQCSGRLQRSPHHGGGERQRVRSAYGLLRLGNGEPWRVEQRERLRRRGLARRRGAARQQFWRRVERGVGELRWIEQRVRWRLRVGKRLGQRLRRRKRRGSQRDDRHHGGEASPRPLRRRRRHAAAERQRHQGLSDGHRDQDLQRPGGPLAEAVLAASRPATTCTCNQAAGRPRRSSTSTCRRARASRT